MPGLMGIDIETYSSAPLPRCGVYRYCDAPDFEILLFSYAFDLSLIHIYKQVPSGRIP